MVAKYRRRHLQLQETERAALDEHTRQCKRDRDPITGWPTKFQIFPDGMTEHTTLTPNVRMNGRTSKQDHGKPELSSRVIGARVVCGEIDEFFVYYTDQLVLKDPDITCELIRQSMADLGRLCKDKHNCLLPKEGFFQFDNCPTENKASFLFVKYLFFTLFTFNQNQTVMGYLSHLVEQGHLTVIHLNFLVVGHTHAPPDQTFSSYSKLIRRTHFLATPQALF